MLLSVGQSAPDFDLPDQSGIHHKLSDLQGKWVLLYFYPKDNTPGCTVEACSLRDSWGSFTAANAAVLGISTDSVDSHAGFASKFDLPFPLLADTHKDVVAQYQALKSKKILGKEFHLTSRISYLIDPAGKIAHVYEQVKPEGHAQQVLSDLKQLQQQMPVR